MSINLMQTFGALVILFAVVGIDQTYADCPDPPDDHSCVCNGDDSEWVCVKWEGTGTPQAGSDFTVDYDCTGCSAAPEVTLLTGEEWEVYAEETTSPNDPVDLGDVTLDPNAATADFEVKIIKGSSAGALDVGEISLIDSEPGSGPTWTGYSSLTEAIIDGDVDGGIAVTSDGSGGSGGGGEIADLSVAGTVDGPITANRITGSSIHYW